MPQHCILGILPHHSRAGQLGQPLEYPLGIIWSLFFSVVMKILELFSEGCLKIFKSFPVLRLAIKESLRRFIEFPIYFTIGPCTPLLGHWSSSLSKLHYVTFTTVKMHQKSFIEITFLIHSVYGLEADKMFCFLSLLARKNLTSQLSKNILMDYQYLPPKLSYILGKP